MHCEFAVTAIVASLADVVIPLECSVSKLPPLPRCEKVPILCMRSVDVLTPVFPDSHWPAWIDALTVIARSKRYSSQVGSSSQVRLCVLGARVCLG